MNTSFDLYVIHSLVAVFGQGFQGSFNEWSPEHIAQGFTWRPGSVSFETLVESGNVQVEVQQAKEINLKPQIQRAIRVPFSIDASGIVEVASTVSEPRAHIFNLPEGSYVLIFETGYLPSLEANGNTDEEDEEYYEPPTWCRLTFIPSDSTQAEILVADANLSPSYPLLMTAQPA